MEMSFVCFLGHSKVSNMMFLCYTPYHTVYMQSSSRYHHSFFMCQVFINPLTSVGENQFFSAEHSRLGNHRSLFQVVKKDEC